MQKSQKNPNFLNLSTNFSQKKKLKTLPCLFPHTKTDCLTTTPKVASVLCLQRKCHVGETAASTWGVSCWRLGDFFSIARYLPRLAYLAQHVITEGMTPTPRPRDNRHPLRTKQVIVEIPSSVSLRRGWMFPFVTRGQTSPYCVWLCLFKVEQDIFDSISLSTCFRLHRSDSNFSTHVSVYFCLPQITIRCWSVALAQVFRSLLHPIRTKQKKPEKGRARL